MALDVQEIQSHESTVDREACPNCGAELLGDYCHKCGQKKIHPNEFSLKRFTKHTLHELTHLDSNKIFKSLAALFLKPGLLAESYLSGRKGKFIGPIRLYLTFSAIYFLFAWGALADARGGGVATAARNPATIAMARQRGVDPRSLAEQAYKKAEKYAGTLRFASVLISGLFLSLLYLGLKKFYVEHLIFSLYYYSFDFGMKSIFALLFLVFATLGAKLPGAVLNLFYPLALLYLTFALRRVYKQRWTLTIIKAVVLFICETLLFIAVNIAGFIIAFSLTS